jgi:uracil-DNA glycosylase
MSATNTSVFNPDCKECPRLATFLDQTGKKYPGYHCAPVAPFGDPGARLLIVGLAPGMHGANATGRPFTGDYAGILLYRTLFEFGYSNRAESTARDDGLELYNCRITNAVKCLPPQKLPQQRTGAAARRIGHNRSRQNRARRGTAGPGAATGIVSVRTRPQPSTRRRETAGRFLPLQPL